MLVNDVKRNKTERNYFSFWFFVLWLSTVAYFATGKELDTDSRASVKAYQSVKDTDANSLDRFVEANQGQ